LVLAGRLILHVGRVLSHPNTEPVWPALDQFFERATPFGCGSVRLATLTFTSPHPKGVRRSSGERTAARRAFARAPAEQFTERFLHPQADLYSMTRMVCSDF